MLTRHRFLAAAALVTLGACRGRAPVVDQPTPRETVPALDTAHGDGAPKVIRVRLTVTDSTIRLDRATVEYGIARTYLADPDLFRVALVGPDTQAIEVVRTYDPLDRRVYPNSNPPDSVLRARGGAATDPSSGRPRPPLRRRAFPFAERQFRQDSATSELFIPFTSAARALKVSNVRGTNYGELSLVDSIRVFCDENRNHDPGCQRWLRNFPKR